MSISRGSNDVFRIGYDNLEVQNTRAVIKNIAGQVTAGTDGIDTFSTEPAGGLERGEMAELVAVSIHDFLGMNSEGANNEQNANGVAQLGSTEEFLLGNVGNPRNTLDPDSDGTDEFRSGFGENNDAQLIYINRQTTTVTWQNTTDGTGGGASQQQTNEFINYRSFLQHGPLFDRDDDLVSIVTLEPKGATDNFEYEHDFQVTLWWNPFHVSELDEETRQSFIGF